MTATSEEQRKLIGDLTKSMSWLCHQVIARRLEQFFEVIGEEVSKDSGALARLLDACNREPGESLLDWEKRVQSVKRSIKKSQSGKGANAK